MEEKILSGKKNGMAVMLLTILLYLATIVGAVFGGMMMDEADDDYGDGQYEE